MGLKEPDAQDRVQDFFAEVVKDDMLRKFDSNRGAHLSHWLMKCFRNIDSNHRRAHSAVKRGGGGIFVEFDPEHAAHSFRAAHIAHLAPEPTFDLMLAREIWRAAQKALQNKYDGKGHEDLVADLLPLVLTDRWPPRPAPSQEELAARHQTSSMRLKAFFNRTLKTQARKHFDHEAALDCPGITESDIQHLWNLLCKYGEE
ncbi:MAG: hypothetical protein IPK32_14475 [Verrucomicrobiaceae bacterium]|nr:hypothetical protein [Verrucomicrobiaceae bacterium]